ncbi:hypothetical protein SPRG_10977 [Saprolegnia parasitica CBS 223.65]|uniref:Uncharacterized protein n=1 Tax=Saprolegnia parasitica (strain CBS 223.65) TaxID=695850 RepID=A0A067C7A0_SAPPC|nr:hypothetical protein SPRG_10977 [Saprolegnia parasitica CBS 223.65]KDO22662.1 hypothetical protein SPRG_10977 [Saprolegnia parasitica CBS 223.65]|eukprot:XP_012206579.1 hypothetical protein SPRG_10977 [Saprolegnia parasitica CBS 223.65]
MMPSSPDSRCKYPYKMCPNTRTFKKDGEPHTLCEYHRNKANSIQKIYATKRRQELRMQRKSPPRSRSPALVMPDPAPFLPDAALAIEPNDLVDLSLLFEDDFSSDTTCCSLEVPDAALFMTSRLFTDRLKLSADDYDILCTLVD